MASSLISYFILVACDSKVISSYQHIRIQSQNNQNNRTKAKKNLVKIIYVMVVAVAQIVSLKAQLSGTYYQFVQNTAPKA